MPLPPLDVTVGSTFLVVTVEVEQGFVWEEPAHEFGCVTVLEKNYGEFTTGYRIWLLEANREKCNEVVTLVRPSWWSGDDTTAEL